MLARHIDRFVAWFFFFDSWESPVAAGAIQTWLAQPRYQEVNPGGAIDITCRVDNKEGECRWEKSGNPIGIFPGKYEWSGNPEDGDCTLRVINASLEYDDGVWQCQVSLSVYPFNLTKFPGISTPFPEIELLPFLLLQVTPSSFTAKDALTSPGAQLVVRERPSTVVVQRVGYNGGGEQVTIFPS